MIFEYPYGYGIRRDNINIRYEALISPVYIFENQLVNNVNDCFDGDPSTFCHSQNTKDSKVHYLQIKFLKFKFILKGFAILNRDCCWNPMKYVINNR